MRRLVIITEAHQALHAALNDVSTAIHDVTIALMRQPGDAEAAETAYTAMKEAEESIRGACALARAALKDAASSR